MSRFVSLTTPCGSPATCVVGWKSRTARPRAWRGVTDTGTGFWFTIEYRIPPPPAAGARLAPPGEGEGEAAVQEVPRVDAGVPVLNTPFKYALAARVTELQANAK